MIDVYHHGPIELLPPLPVSRSELILTGARFAPPASTVYVVLDHLSTETEFPPTDHPLFAGTIRQSDLTDGRAVLDITAALNRALKERPNFDISFLTEKAGNSRTPAFSFHALEITHEHAVPFDHGLSADVVHH
ncbi:hypothetical protein [Pontiella sp.]|uniref:hypothetical protein n=1 Tax=Pontiella sp. TaxID=2837462 RepID=UPI00356872CE